jgi:heptosyltransferase-2
MKILVIQIKMIGDVLASTVICEAIKKEHPNCVIHYLIQKNTIPVVENNPFIDKIILFEEQNYKGINGLFKLGKELKAERYDTIIDAYGKLQSLIPTYLSGAKKRIGTYKWYSKFFLTQTVIPDTKCNGTANAFRILLAKTALNKEIPVIFPKIYLTETEISKAKTQIFNELDRSKKIIMISVLGSGKNKSLPNHYMAEILNTIALTSNAQLVFNYMPNQQKEAEAIFELCNEETKSKTIYAPWINRNSWNIFEETGLHEIVHLSDYFPELYKNKHPKNFKEKSPEWYDKLHPSLFLVKLQNFVTKISR